MAPSLLGVDTLQVFLIDNPPGTGDSGLPGFGGVGEPLGLPQFGARSGDKVSVLVDAVRASNGRDVMFNEGIQGAAVRRVPSTMSSATLLARKTFSNWTGCHQ